MKKLVLFLALMAGLIAPAIAQDWYVGLQSKNYTTSHPLGDGVTNPRGGEAPYFANEVADIPTPSSLASSFTGSISGTTLTVSSLTGTITNGQPLTGPGIQSGVTLSGCTGSPTSSCTISSSTGASFTGSISGTTLTTSGVSGNLVVGQVISGAGIPGGTQIINWPGASGPNYTISTSLTVSSEAMTSAVPSESMSSGWLITCLPADTGGAESNCGSWKDAGAGGSEAKARFDCNDTFDEPSDPILKPGQSGTNLHDHHFFGNIAAQGNMALVNYAWLRAHGNSTCYGGPLNRTLYWEPTMYTTVNNVPKVSIKAYNVVTYYVCGVLTDGQYCTRWPRGWAAIFGFDFNDPANTRLRNQITLGSGLATPSSVWANQSIVGKGNGLINWSCGNPASPGYTAYAPVAQNGQPYLNDGQGHTTLNCLDNTAAGQAGAANMPHGIEVIADLQSQDCWDGQNPRSPNGRDHLAYFTAYTDGHAYCPDGWFRIPHFEVKVYFMFKDTTEMGSLRLSSDIMPGMYLASFQGSISGTTLTVPGGANILQDISNHVISGAGIPGGTAITLGGCTGSPITSCTLNANLGSIGTETINVLYNGGETMHADLMPAWDYGTGDHPGVMVTFFQQCDGISMHLKNSDGVTYTDLAGSSHECSTGRSGGGMQLYTTQASPDGSTPNPLTNLNPDYSSSTRFFPLVSGTPLPGSVLHTH